MRRAKRRQRAAQSSRLPEVVVAYSGYLNVAVPEHGASARRHVIDPLQADTIVSGSYKPTDCGGSEAVQDKPRRYRCLWSNLVGLEPITSRELNRKLRDEEIRAIVERAPHWPAVKAAFNPAQTAFGMTVWAPLLGSPRGHMIHQIRDYSLLYKLLLRHERARVAVVAQLRRTQLEAERGVEREREVGKVDAESAKILTREALVRRRERLGCIGRLERRCSAPAGVG